MNHFIAVILLRISHLKKHIITFKIANTEEEFEQIFRLNYETFALEIPQHQQNEYCRLVDKFHHENTYFICKKIMS